MNAVLGFLDGKYKPLAEWASRKSKCMILDDPKHICLYFKLCDPHPVPLGKWMQDCGKSFRGLSPVLPQHCAHCGSLR